MIHVRHLGGPMGGPSGDVSLSSLLIPDRLLYAPMSDQDGVLAGSNALINGYLLVGVDPGTATDEPWPGQVEYRLDRGASELRPHPEHGDAGMLEGLAIYTFVGDAGVSR